MADTTNTRTDRKRNDRSVNTISGVRELRNGIETLLSDSPRSRPGSGLVDSLTNSLISSGLVNAGDYYSGAGSDTIQEGFDYTGIPGGNYLGMLTPKDAAELVFNHNEALYDRQFQEYMSNTSYQRAVADMSAAGINPVLAYRNGGAITPSGSAASAPSGSSAMDLFGLLVNLLGQKNQLAIAGVQADATVESAKISAAAQKYGTEEGKAEAKANARLMNAEAEIKELSKDDVVRNAKSNADLTEKKVAECEEARKAIIQQIEESRQTVQTAKAQAALYVAEAFFKKAEAWQIGRLTEPMARAYDAKADADAVTAEIGMIRIDSGEIKAICDEAIANAKNAGLKAEVNEAIVHPENFNEEFTLAMRILTGKKLME